MWARCTLSGVIIKPLICSATLQGVDVPPVTPQTTSETEGVISQDHGPTAETGGLPLACSATLHGVDVPPVTPQTTSETEGVISPCHGPTAVTGGLRQYFIKEAYRTFTPCEATDTLRIVYPIQLGDFTFRCEDFIRFLKVHRNASSSQARVGSHHAPSRGRRYDGYLVVHPPSFPFPHRSPPTASGSRASCTCARTSRVTM